MALLFVDSFDHYTSLVTKGWLTGGTATAIDNTAARTGIGGAHFAAGSPCTLGYQLASAAADLWVGFAFQVPGSGSTFSSFPFFAIECSNPYATIVELKSVPAGAGLFNITATLEYGSGATTVTLGTSTQTIQQGTWNYLEVAILSGTGFYELRVNGATWISGTNANLISGGISLIDWIGLNQASPSSYEMYIDDVYMCDNTGAQNNGFLGPISISCLLPIEDGNITAWTRGGTDTGANFSQINENPTDDLTTYISETVDGADNTSIFAPVASLGVMGVVVNICCQNNATAPRRLIRAICGSPDSFAQFDNGVDLEPPQTPEWQILQAFFPTDPALGGEAWTPSLINGTEFGVKLSG